MQHQIFYGSNRSEWNDTVFRQSKKFFSSSDCGPFQAAVFLIPRRPSIFSFIVACRGEYFSLHKRNLINVKFLTFILECLGASSSSCLTITYNVLNFIQTDYSPFVPNICPIPNTKISRKSWIDFGFGTSLLIEEVYIIKECHRRVCCIKNKITSNQNRNRTSILRTSIMRYCL